MGTNKIVRVILDTNIIVKFMISERPVTAAKKIMFALDEAMFISIVSDELLSEIYNTLKYMIPENIAENAIFDLEFKSTKVEFENGLSTGQELVRDFSDSKVMQTAIEGDADFLVTSNIHDFSKYFITKSGKKGETIRPRKFLNILGISK
jgi:putative PIN family toxin of toxin-antitoxin system